MNYRLDIRNLIQFALLTAFIAGALSGCAALEEPETPRPLAAQPPVAKKPAPRELGTLWSDDSMWNHVYTATSARVVGDIITIHLDDRFKSRILAYREPVPESAPKSGTPERAVASDPAPAATPTDKSVASDLVVRGVIEEVGPRGIYRISAGDNVEISGWEPYVVVKGRVRDRDISASDEVKIGDIVDLNLDVLKAPPVPGDSQGVENVSW